MHGDIWSGECYNDQMNVSKSPEASYKLALNDERDRRALLRRAPEPFRVAEPFKLPSSAFATEIFPSCTLLEIY